MAQKVGKTVMKSMLHHKDVMAVMGLVGAAGVLGGIALIYSAVHDPDISLCFFFLVLFLLLNYKEI
ncbi:Hypothetical predicted protein [Mytilus galloprovincialis]|uniref:Uncharacterized protein n=1 Tax=Mytilus galloprovincialis TaxID=29158 RepID=A0A8B6GP11_MYTGA|nr:Hypothetical predicted protein [Mytilus galloprovincialis]